MERSQVVVPEGKLYNKADVEAIAAIIRRMLPGFKPGVGVVLGTGFADFTVENVDDAQVIPFDDLPLFSGELQTPGHISELVLGKMNGHDILFARGKMFLLDGVSAQLVALPVRLFHLLGARTLLYTNAAGAINPKYSVGDFVFLSNHINLMARNPLVGEKNGEWGEMFFDMTYPYDEELRTMAKAVAAEMGLKAQEGVYAGLLGPSFETAAEIRMLATIGADLVGMSTIMEVVAARQVGMKVLAYSFISNMAAGVKGDSLDNEEVLRNAGMSRQKYSRLMKELIRRLQALQND